MSTCQYCKKTFKQESTAIRHLCEKKRRYLAKDEKHVQLGYKAFVRFYELSQRIPNKTFDDFIESSFHSQFVKFGSFLSNTNPLYPLKFIDYMINSQVKFEKWCDDETYRKYICHLVQTESVETALERSILYMQDWAERNNTEWTEYFKRVGLDKGIADIQDGRISPWLILQSTTGKDMLRMMSNEHLTLIESIINPDVWMNKFKRKHQELRLVKDVVDKCKI
jgi:hypothetical protein